MDYLWTKALIALTNFEALLLTSVAADLISCFRFGLLIDAAYLEGD